MSRWVILLFFLTFAVFSAALPPVAGQEPATNLTASPELISWITVGESNEDISSLVSQITTHEEKGIYDYWIIYSQGSYHIWYGGILEGIRG
jgi:hypothetical protein